MRISVPVKGAENVNFDAVAAHLQVNETGKAPLLSSGNLTLPEHHREDEIGVCQTTRGWPRKSRLREAIRRHTLRRDQRGLVVVELIIERSKRAERSGR